MLSDTTPTSLMTQANVYTFSNDEKKRREGALKNKDFYYGRQQQYLNLVNDNVDPITVNLTNSIISKRASLLYNRKLVREFDGPSASISALESVYDYLSIDDIMQNIDLSAELTGTALVFVGINDSTGEVELKIYDASSFSVISENDVDIDALQLVTVVDQMSEKKGYRSLNADVKRVIKSEIWTNNYIYKVIDNIPQGNAERNELGYIPFTPFKAQEVITQYIGHTPAINTRQLNQAFNQIATNLGYMIKMQSATPIVLTGFSNGEALSVHPGTAISLPAGAEAKALQLNPKIGETLDYLKYIEEKIYESSSIPKISIVGGVNSSSGIELIIKWAPLSSLKRDKEERYNDYEFNLANMILNRLNLEPIDNISIKYPDNHMPIDPNREYLEEDIKLNIKTAADEIMKLDPYMTKQEAEGEVLTNKDFNDNIRIRSGGMEEEPLDNTNDNK